MGSPYSDCTLNGSDVPVKNLYEDYAASQVRGFLVGVPVVLEGGPPFMSL